MAQHSGLFRVFKSQIASSWLLGNGSRKVATKAEAKEKAHYIHTENTF